ncbi:hypothetical protein [Treponema primitia]|uniref:hypothetical protein n=1 Tax=Treponema primitia TaxID=88058 RepID=UPI0002554D54|nr:hypothetical protein [Treponema primitia]
MINETLLRRVPPILRARDFRLYTQDGRRLVDLWQYGGAAILGHTPAGLLRTLKNTAQRGLFAPLPHPQEKRLLKALATLLPGMTFRLYRSDTALRHALEAGGFPEPVLWRPFRDSALPPDQPCIPVLPLPWSDALGVLAVPPETAAAFPPSEIISAVILAAATRGVYDLIAATPARGQVSYPRIEEALANEAAAGRWLRQGIYLHCSLQRSSPRSPDLNDEAYGKIFTHFLEHGFLIPPDQNQPLILPWVLSAGEESKLAELLAKAI